MPTNILVECTELIASVKLGVLESLRPLEEDGKAVVKFIPTEEIRKNDIVWSDILITVRGSGPVTANIVREASKAGRLIIYYLDDNLLNVPDESLVKEYYDDPLVRDGMTETLSNTDILWGVNLRIRDIYLPLTKGRWLINKVSKEPMPASDEAKSGPIKILYAGGKDHIVIVREILSPMALKLCEMFGDSVDITFIGVDPGISGLENVHYIPFIKPYEKYCDFTKNGNFSIGLAPARDDPFFACKYYNKFLEYASIGAVGVFSNVEPYTQVVENGKNGILCENDIDSWAAAVETLINDKKLLNSCRRNIQDQLINEFSKEAVTEEIVSQCPELIEYKAPDCDENSIHLQNPFFLYCFCRAKYYFGKYGLLSIPLIILKGIKVTIINLLKGFNKLVKALFGRN